MAWHRRLLNAVRPERLSHDLDREMAFHLAERTDDLVARGMSRADAAREARRQFGNLGVQKDRMRDADILTWLESLGADLRYAVRALRASPGFALVAILSLGLGIGANTAIFSLINTVVLEKLPVSRPEELVQVRMGGGGGGYFTNPIWEEIRDRQNVFAGVFSYGDEQFNLADGGEARFVAANSVSGDFFTTLGVRAAAGRLLARGDDYRGCPGVAVLGHAFWRSEYAGATSAVGSTISLQGHPFDIVGVVDPTFFGMEVGRSPQVYIPLCALAVIHGKASGLDARSTWFLRIIGRPREGVTGAQLRDHLGAIAPAVFAATVPERWTGEVRQDYLQRTLTTGPAAKGLSDLREEYRRPLFVLMALVAVVLLIACANVANLLLARATVRRREIGVRLALGAGRGRLVRQLLTESVLLAFVGAAVGVLFARWGSSLVVGLLSSQAYEVWLDLSLDGRVLAFTIAVAMMTGILFGLAPAWRSVRVRPQGVLKSNGRGVAEGHSRFSAGKALVMAQIALSLVLVIGAGLLLGSFRRLVTLDPGFRREGVLLVSVSLPKAQYPADRYGMAARDILDRLRALPGVESASASELTPISGLAWNSLIAVDGYRPGGSDDALAYFNRVSDGYFATLGTGFVAGRDFDRRDHPASAAAAIINQTMARQFFGGANPLGRQFRVQGPDKLGPPIEVVGVVADAKYQELREATLPTAYLAMSQDSQPSPYATYELRVTGTPETLIPAVKALMNQVNPRISLGLTTLSDQVDVSLARDRLLATLSGFFGGLALLLAMIGLYGTLSYSVARRRNEIGIRIALGAMRSNVVRLVLVDVARVLVMGLALGVLLALVTTRVMSSFLYGLTASDPTTWGVATVTLAVVSAVAGALPAWRASRLDPIAALRED